MGKIGMRLWLAIKVFFSILFRADTAKQAARILIAGSPAETQRTDRAEPAAERPAPRPSRSDAVTLLATLQREARFVDFVQESLDGYSDAQIGAAARDVHRDCGKALERMFEIRPLLDQQEGTPVQVPVGFDANRYRLTGNVTGEPPYEGSLAHHGWQAARCELPTWSGSDEAVMVLAPAEIELA
jgi:hypothetical protein